MVSGARGGRACTRRTAFRPSCSKPWPPSTTSRFDWAGFQPRDGAARHRFGRRPADGAVQDRPARRAEESDARHASSSATKRPRPTAQDRRHHRPRPTVSRRSTKIGHAQPITVVLDSTPFYGESGGQVGDTGEIVGHGLPLRGDRHAEGRRLHRCTSAICAQGMLTAGRDGHGPRRRRRAAPGIRRAHSATHILHYALQKHLGKHAQQQGSKVDDDWLRFDFANPVVGRPRRCSRRSRAR